MIDINELRRLAQDQQWIGRWYDAGCETLMAERNGEHEEVAHPIPIGLVPYLIAVQPASILELLDRLEAAESECLEQARLNGMGASREATLLAKVEAAEKERDALRVENEALAANLRGKHSTAGATYAHLIAERDALRAALRHEADCVEAAKAEIEALRARIEAMERQGPVAWARKLGLDVPSFGCVTDLKYRPSNIPESSYIPLYALPGAQAQPAPSVPSAEAAEAMGEKGGPVVEAERIAFEAWMRGHCWNLCAEWTGTQYLSAFEKDGMVDTRAMRTREIWAAWRDRAALAAAPEAKP